MVKLYDMLFETGPSAQSAIPTLGDDPRRVSRTGVAAQDNGFLDIVDTMDLDVDSPEDDWDSTFPQEDEVGNKITP
jgi:hypothetical protein